MNSAKTWLAPAKLNLFLRITGRRTDGYHLLQTLFQIVDLYDELKFHPREDQQITLRNQPADWSQQQDLCVRAAKLLAPLCPKPVGIDIELTKKIPIGAGLGGGSSDAATTLIALNHYWGLNLNKQQLCEIGLQLGADVPLFIFGQTAWAEGIGEELSAVDLPHHWYLIVTPDCQVPTATIFTSEQLTRNSPSITIRAYLDGLDQSIHPLESVSQSELTKNDCLPVVRSLYPAVDAAFNWLQQHGMAQLSGTGASLFCECKTQAAAQQIQQLVPTGWQSFVVQSVLHPEIDD
ncbi:MAG: 4-(cytidine 5'-diphospho)-2-C-methyl-D-erythritol kinase [Immundisolibacteraceae bacterium]|nr:4-(cytidine 5'-diphospho)-2-C-methyl-D-erythritol kinase [Immundisolibacteraceae bacterium]